MKEPDRYYVRPTDLNVLAPPTERGRLIPVVCAEYYDALKAEDEMSDQAFENAHRNLVACQAENAALRAENQRLRAAIDPYLGDKNCRHDRVHTTHGGRSSPVVISYKSCGECGAFLDLVSAMGSRPE